MIAILGGGISGLTAAFQLKRQGKAFILLEANKKLGGKIQSKREKGYTMEMGPNTVLINNGEIKTLIDQLGLSEELIFADPIASKNRFVLKNQTIEPIPNSFATAVKSNLFGFSTIKAIISELFKERGRSEQEESLATFCRRRFGQQILDDFITPFVTGIYAGDPEKMSINYTLSILKEAEEKHGSVLRGMVKIMKEKKRATAHLQLPKQKSFTFQQGLHRLADAIQKEIQEEIQLDARIESIKKNGAKYSISYVQGNVPKTVEVDKIIAAMPSHNLAKVIAPIAPELVDPLSDIQYVPALAVHLGFSSSQMKFKSKAFGILSRKEEGVPFLGILFNSHFFPHTAPQGKTLISVICGGARYPEIIEKSEEQIVKEVEQSVRALLGIQDNFELKSIVKWQQGIPQYNLGYSVIESAIDQFLEQHSNFYIAANFYKGISVSDCIKNASLLAQRI